MDTHRAQTFTLLVLLLLSSDRTTAALRYDQERPLTSLHGPAKQNSIAQLDAVLDGLLVESNHGPLAIVVYVHGRGNEPEKSFQDTKFTSGFLLQKLETQNVSVLGYNWRSKIKPFHFCERPVVEARAAALGLRRLIQDLERHQLANPQRWKARRAVLLAHSMGNIVVAEAMRDPGTLDSAKRLFNTIVLSASDEPAHEHFVWQDHMPQGLVYVLSNPEDRFLKRSMSCGKNDPSARLGLISAADSSVQRALTSTYIEIPAGSRHRYISRGAQERNPSTCKVITTLLQGNKPEFPQAWRVADNPARIRIPLSEDPGDSCFKGIRAERSDAKDS
ncbi:MAG: alpha/beta hydrolase [Xanthomonadaceae bacterium]|nr:alpha/beta hydrolase [Xanthomonadaceae bacterium]